MAGELALVEEGLFEGDGGDGDGGEAAFRDLLFDEAANVTSLDVQQHRSDQQPVLR